MSKTEKVEALVGFHFHDGVGVSYAGIGDVVDMPVGLIDNFVSIGRVRRLAHAAEVPSPAVPSEPPAPHPLDHDGDGRPGGSLPAAERGMAELWAEAEALGIRVDRRRTGPEADRRLRAAIEKRRG